MIYQQITLTLAEEQVQRIKSLNAKILQHLEDDFALHLAILEKLKTELSGIVKEMPEFIEVLEKINSSGDYYDIQLLHEDNEILNLPWHMATGPVSEKQLGNIQQLLISNGLPDYFKVDHETQSQLAPPLKILIMISSPEDADYKNRLSFEEEDMLILQAFQPLLQKGLAQIDYTDDGSLDALRRKIKTNKYHILHYSGHADFKDGKGQLILEQALSLKTESVQADDFADALNCNPEYKIPMVVLSSCQTAKGSNEQGIRGVTNHLLKVGIPSIISMGMSIKDKYAVYFSANFYEQLANRQNIPMAFKLSLEYLREFEFSEQARGGVANPVPLQWIIPNLYRSERITHLVDWDKAKTDLQFSSYQFVYEQDRLLLKHEKNYLFIGRRRDKAKIQPCLFDKKPIMLKGQGGVGKTAMAEHLVQRLITADAGTQPFIFNETTKSIREIRKKLENYLDEKGQQYRTELNDKEEGLDQFKYLVSRVSALCEPVFIFDNLESFQASPDGPFSEEYQDIKEVINSLCKSNNRQVILTGRYTIPDLDYVQSFDLNQAAINDFWKKCYYLELVKIAEFIHKNRKEKQERNALQKEELQFSDIVKLLHRNFGGNYRALEIFNELFKRNPQKISDALDTLDNFRDKYRSETEEVKTKMSKNLVFVDLLDLLETDQKEILELMSHFRVPVQLLALQLQLSGRNRHDNLADNLLYLHDLTLLEISMDPETETVYYYSTPIVKDLLDTISKGPTHLSFSHQQAGTYYYYNHHNLSSSLTELEEAFYHFHLASNKEKVQEIGDKLSGLYYSYSLYKNSFYYAGQVQQLLGEETGSSTLNLLGLILDLYGNYDQALFVYQKALSAFQEIGDKSGEGTTLNNISQIHDARGDYETALDYLERSLKIRQEIGDKSGEGTTLNNISGIYRARGDYETALDYLERSLKISQEIGDKSGEGTTLNNISGIYRARGDYEIALDYLERSLKISQEIGDKSGMIATLHNMALIAYGNKDYEKDFKYASEAYSLSVETQDAMGLFHVGQHYGQIVCSMGKKDEGIKILKTSYQIGKQAGFPDIEVLSDIIEQLENS